MKAIILAAGKGERLRPLTETRPKPLLPVGNKPIIGHIVEMLNKHAIDEIAIVTGYLGDSIRKYLGNDYTYYQDKRLSGTATALYSARNFIDDDFLLVYGDIFFDGSLSEIVNKPDSMLAASVDDVSRYGRLLLDRTHLKHVSEKSSSGPGLVNAGIYHFTPNFMDSLSDYVSVNRNEYPITDVINEYVGNHPITVVTSNGFWSDIGYPHDYLDVNMYYLSKVGTLIDDGADVWPSATVKNSIIGPDTVVKSSVVENAVIGQGCTIGEFSVVKRSVLMDYSNAPHLNYVADSVVGASVNLGAGTKVANLRFDEHPVKINVKGRRISTGKRKFGAVIGDGVKTGINVSILPGVKIGSNSKIYPGVVVSRDVESNSFIEPNE